jgi:glucose/arabinose dehydrogenase
LESEEKRMFNRRGRYAVVPPPTNRIPAKPSDYYLESGYRLEPLIAGLTFPTGMTFDDRGILYIIEAGYSYGPAYSAKGGRILRFSRGRVEEVAGNFRPPLTGITWHEGYFYVAEGAFPGRILQVSEDGATRKVLVDGLQTCGDHMTGDVIVGEDNRLYFGVGTATNSGVVGLDNLPWLLIRPQCHDIPCRDFILRGIDYETINIFEPYESEMVSTGVYQPFGVSVENEEVLEGELKCSGVIYSTTMDGRNLKKYADGLRNPFGLGFSPWDQLYTIDQGYDLRGSRPVANSPDTLWPIFESSWYGWPDYVSGIPIANPRFDPPGGPPLKFLLEEHPGISVDPSYRFPHGDIPMKFDFSPGGSFGSMGDMFIAEYGGAAPHVFVNDGDEIGIEDKNRRGFRVVRLNSVTGKIDDFLVNKKPGLEGTGMERPIDVKFTPDGNQLFVLDYGYVLSDNAGWKSFANSGILWSVRPV